MSINIYKDGQLKSVAGSGLMDAELSLTSTNGVQNKVVTAAINELNNDLADIESSLSTKQNKAWNTIGHFSGTQTLNITNALAYNEIQIIARMTPPNAYVTKLSDIYRGGDFANERVDQMIALGASFGGTLGIGVLCKYSWKNKTLAIEGAYYNTALDTQNVTVFVYAR